MTPIEEFKSELLPSDLTYFYLGDKDLIARNIKFVQNHHSMLKYKLFLSALFLSPLALICQGKWDLEKCIQHALDNNIQIKQSELNLQLAGISQELNFGAFLPNLNANASHGYNWGQTIDPFTNQFATERIQSNSFGIGTGMTLFNGFQNVNRYKQGMVNIEARQADLKKMINDVALNVANSYLNVLFNQEFLKIASGNLDATQQQVDRINKLVEAGAAPKGNLYDIESQLASDNASLISAKNNLNIAKLVLVQLLQLNAQEASEIEIISPEIGDLSALSLPSSARAAVENALANFPEMKSAEAGVRSSENGVAIAKGRRSPQLDMSFSYGTGFSGANQQPVGDLELTGNSPIGFVDGSNEVVLAPTFGYSDFQTKPFGDQLSDNINSSLFFRLTIPIFNGFNTKAGLEQAQVQKLQADYILEQTEQQLTQDVERAYADALAAYNNYLASETALNAAETAFEYATVQFEAGVTNTIDYSNSRIRRDNTQADLIRNKYDYLFRLKVIEFYQGNALTLKQ